LQLIDIISTMQPATVPCAAITRAPTDIAMHCYLLALCWWQTNRQLQLMPPCNLRLNKTAN